MLSRILAILFFGSLFALIPVAMVIGGVLEGYINYYQVKDCGRQVFYNPFFYDTIFYAGYGWYMLLLAIFAGIFIVYPPFFASFFRFIYVFIIILAICSFIPSVGLKLGEMMFAKPNMNVQLTDGNVVQLNVVYAGREGLHFLTPDKPYTLTYRWGAIVGGQKQRCYREDPSLIAPLPDMRGASPAESAAVGIEPLPEKKSMFEVLMKRLFP